MCHRSRLRSQLSAPLSNCIVLCCMYFKVKSSRWISSAIEFASNSQSWNNGSWISRWRGFFFFGKTCHRSPLAAESRERGGEDYCLHDFSCSKARQVHSFTSV